MYLVLLLLLLVDDSLLCALLGQVGSELLQSSLLLLFGERGDLLSRFGEIDVLAANIISSCLLPRYSQLTSLMRGTLLGPCS